MDRKKRNLLWTFVLATVALSALWVSRSPASVYTVSARPTVSAIVLGLLISLGLLTGGLICAVLLLERKEGGYE